MQIVEDKKKTKTKNKPRILPVMHIFASVFRLPRSFSCFLWKPPVFFYLANENVIFKLALTFWVASAHLSSVPCNQDQHVKAYFCYLYGLGLLVSEKIVVISILITEFPVFTDQNLNIDKRTLF